MGTAIVAIPKQDDYVWNISSEKIPHMTLLFLGDLAGSPTLPHIEEFLGHVINTTLNRFSMTVDHRGVLGVDNADVLFFDDYNNKMLKRFRDTLLQDQAIFQAYNSILQFEGWVPHLTLGYPATPAKKDTCEYPGISWVNFDRIAIWTGDFEGTTFDIPSWDSEVMSMSGEDTANSILAHYGKKGMKWGVRNRSTVDMISREGTRTPIHYNPKKAHVITRPDGTRTIETKSKHEAKSIQKQFDKIPSVSPDARRANQIKKAINRHGLDAASNTDLQLLRTRLELEKPFHQTVTQNKSLLKKGGHIAEDILTTTGSKLAKEWLYKEGAKKLGIPAKAAKGAKTAADIVSNNSDLVLTSKLTSTRQKLGFVA